MDKRRRVRDGILQGALGVGERLGRRAERHGFANVVAALGAQIAVVAREADLEGDIVAWLQVGDLGADGGDGAGGFVAEGQGLADLDVAVAEVGKVVQVGAAEACGAHFDENVGGGELGESALFLGRRVLEYTVVCFGGGGRFECAVVRFEFTYHSQVLCAVEHRGSYCLSSHCVCCGELNGAFELESLKVKCIVVVSRRSDYNS